MAVDPAFGGNGCDALSESQPCGGCSGSGPSAGMIVAIVIGVILSGMLVGLGIWVARRARRAQHEERDRLVDGEIVDSPVMHE